MQLKKVMLLVDNRPIPSSDITEYKNNTNADFRGSAFKATQVDAAEEHQQSCWQEALLLSQLQKRVQNLEEKVKKLQNGSGVEFLNKKKRRKAAQIAREYECPHEECGKLYGSETSLKNHLKLKHGVKN